jgi:hypothetical protein
VLLDITTRRVLHWNLTEYPPLSGRSNSFGTACLSMHVTGSFYTTATASSHLHSRTHLALDKDTPVTRPVSPLSAGRIVATPEVGGLHHRYDRIAA